MAPKKLSSTLTREELIRQNKDLRQQIDELKKLEEVKNERREREYTLKFYAFLESFTEPIFIVDALTYKFIYWNEAAYRHYRYTKADIAGMTLFDIHIADDYNTVKDHFDKKVINPQYLYTHVTQNREQRKVELMVMDFYVDNNPAWVSVVHDISERIAMEEELDQYKHRLEEMVNERTIEVLEINKKLRQEIQERRKAEHAITESEKKFRSIIEKSLDGMVLVNESGTIIEWNEGQEKIYQTKRHSAIGEKIWDVQFHHLPKEARTEESYSRLKTQWENFFKTGVNPFQDNLQVAKIERPGGSLRDVQQLCFPIETDHGLMMAFTNRDMTDKIILESQLMQSQKMEAMGMMAGGIAHDFNNILGGILGYAELALRKTEKTSPVYRFVEQVISASHRATEMVKQILTFSRLKSQEKGPVKLGFIVKEALKLIRTSVPTTIEIISKVEDMDSYVLGDSTQLHQVLMNLCTNAAHAMKEKGGVMEVRLTREEIEPGLYKGLREGPHLRLTVSDSGCGIKPEIIDKIFDPFFTTKKEGEGTGMGLAVVMGIVENHQGNISVYSKEGEGTTFSILFPITNNVILKQEQKDENIPGGTERLLLVEDDVQLAEAEKKLLEELGYQVTAVNGGVEALEIFQKFPNRFDIIITDYIMPRMKGDRFIHHVRSIRKEIPVILCTGYSNVASDMELEDIGVGEIVAKPIELGNIARTIRLLLNSRN
ncbi:MAG: ATP-binding protein [Candidatus Omnitrophota bacterium]